MIKAADGGTRLDVRKGRTIVRLRCRRRFVRGRRGGNGRRHFATDLVRGRPWRPLGRNGDSGHEQGVCVWLCPCHMRPWDVMRKLSAWWKALPTVNRQPFLACKEGDWLRYDKECWRADTEALAA